MADVFISYAREDLERARTLANALEARGWSVWWDRRIVTGETFDQTIERELESAKSVVVLWSADSALSEWTKNEATAAAERGVLVPAVLDDVRIPLEFRRKQTANLIDWDGDPSNEGFQALCEGIAGRVGAPAAPLRSVERNDAARRPNHEWWRSRTAAATAILVVAALAVGLSVWGGGGDGGDGQQTATNPAQGEPARPPVATTAADGGSLDVAKPDVLTVPPADANGIDHPAPLALGAIHTLALDTNEDYYLRLTVPAGALRIVQDMRVSGKGRSLQSALSLLDQNGVVAERNVIRFNKADIAARKTATIALKQPNVTLRLLNNGGPVDIWLTVLAQNDSTFIPLFGSLVPSPMSGPGVSGQLEPNQSVYWVNRFAPGTYRVFVDFTNPESKRAALQGTLTMLDADGGNEQRVTGLNTHDIRNRKTGNFSLTKEEQRIFRLFNAGAAIDYSIKIEKVK